MNIYITDLNDDCFLHLFKHLNKFDVLALELAYPNRIFPVRDCYTKQFEKFFLRGDDLLVMPWITNNEDHVDAHINILTHAGPYIKDLSIQYGSLPVNDFMRISAVVRDYCTSLRRLHMQNIFEQCKVKFDGVEPHIPAMLVLEKFSFSDPISCESNRTLLIFAKYLKEALSSDRLTQLRIWRCRSLERNDVSCCVEQMRKMTSVYVYEYYSDILQASDYDMIMAVPNVTHLKFEFDGHKACVTNSVLTGVIQRNMVTCLFLPNNMKLYEKTYKNFRNFTSLDKLQICGPAIEEDFLNYLITVPNLHSVIVINRPQIYNFRYFEFIKFVRDSPVLRDFAYAFYDWPKNRELMEMAKSRHIDMDISGSHVSSIYYFCNVPICFFFLFLGKTL